MAAGNTLTYLGTVAALPGSGSTASSIYQVTAGTTVTTSEPVYALKVTAATLTLTTGTSLTVGGTSGQAGLILNTNGSSTGASIAVGAGTPTLAFGNQEGVIFSGGGGTATNSIATTITGTAGITEFGPTTLVLSGTNSYTGTTTVNGTLSIPGVSGADTNLGAVPTSVTSNALVFNGGTLINTAAVTLAANRGIVLNVAGGTLAPATGITLTVNGAISGVGELTKSNTTGILVLNGANTYTGGTIILGGTVDISADNNLGGTINPVTIAGGTLTSLDNMTLSSLRGIVLGSGGGTISPASGTTLTVSGQIGGTTALTDSGTGVLVLSGPNAYSGGTVVSTGATLSVGADNNLARFPPRSPPPA